MRFTIGPTLYDMESLDRLTLLQILRLEIELRDLGKTNADGSEMKWRHIRVMAQSMEALEDPEESDDFWWIIGLAIWASRLCKGEDLPFADAINFSMGDLTFLPDPEDHKAPANPRKPPKGSLGGAGTPRRNGTKATKKTSAGRSSPA